MITVPDYKCRCNNSEEIPLSVIKMAEVNYAAAYAGGMPMALTAEAIKKDKDDSICKVPFCVTVEAEAFGTKVVIPDKITGPRFVGYKFSRIEDMLNLQKINLSSGRISEVLASVELLAKRGNVVALNVEAPFTILALLIDSVLLYKAIYKQREIVERVLAIIETNIEKYILAAIERGASIISYADPSGVAEIVGPKISREISGRSSYSVLKNIESSISGAVVHLCGKTSLSLEKAGLCSVKAVDVEQSITYGEAIIRLVKESSIKFIGHNCMKITPVHMSHPVVWQVNLK
ncbi:MAG: hypothetical protein LLG02_02125 [Pelosinus sp.]|nr:hypothetical protein [Pelosinus sp.]